MDSENKCSWTKKNFGEKHICAHETYKEGNFCILHDPREDKNVEDFKRLLVESLNSGNKQINLLEIKFPKGAIDLKNIKLAEGVEVSFYQATLPKEARVYFDGATLGEGARVSFAEAKLGERSKISFTRATLGEGAEVHFYGATLAKGEARWLSSIFETDADFSFVDATLAERARVSFEKATLVEEGWVSFAGAILGEGAGVSFAEAKLGERSDISFTRATLGEGARVSFEKATLAEEVAVSFAEAKLGEGADISFKGATLGEETKVSFHGASFAKGTRVSLDKASLKKETEFLLDEASLTEESEVSCLEAKLERKARVSFLRAKLIEAKVYFDKASLAEGAKVSFLKTIVSNGTEISFESTYFLGEFEFEFDFLEGNPVINFSNAVLLNPEHVHVYNANLGRTRFINAKTLNRIKFNNVAWYKKREVISWRGREIILKKRNALYDEEILREQLKNGMNLPFKAVEELYRQLKDNYEHHGNYPDAGDFYIGEMEMRRLNPHTNRWERLLLNLYRYLSLYGEVYWLPPLWIASWLFLVTILMMYGGVAIGSEITKVDYINYDFSFALSDKKAVSDFVRIFIENFKAVTLQQPNLTTNNILGAIIQSFVAPVGVFLFAIWGLALRRRFKR